MGIYSDIIGNNHIRAVFIFSKAHWVVIDESKSMVRPEVIGHCATKAEARETIKEILKRGA